MQYPATPCTSADFKTLATWIHSKDYPATHDQVIDLFIADYTSTQTKVDNYLSAQGYKFNETQRDALVDFDYNQGSLSVMQLDSDASIVYAMETYMYQPRGDADADLFQDGKFKFLDGGQIPTSWATLPWNPALVTQHSCSSSRADECIIPVPKKKK